MCGEGGEDVADEKARPEQVTSRSVIAILIRFRKSKIAPQGRMAIILGGVGGAYLWATRKRTKSVVSNQNDN